jgi:hypothetical protein
MRQPGAGGERGRGTGRTDEPVRFDVTILPGRNFLQLVLIYLSFYDKLEKVYASLAAG